MGGLGKWNFSDQEINAKSQQVNRQKSAIKLKVIELNKAKGIGVFWDKRNGEIKASLTNCECKDFNFSGKSTRKTFVPCMHIYRLAIAMELMIPVFFDTKEKKRHEEIKLLQEKRKDPTQWGEWNFKIHLYNVQKKRQVSAYDIREESHNNINIDYKSDVLHGYETTLSTCKCPDYMERKLPCKHIYYLALLLREKLEITESDYENYKEERYF